MKTRIKNLLLLPALIAGLGLMLAGRVTAQTFTTLHSFTATSNDSSYINGDGGNPQAGLILSGNTLYGTAAEGGSAGNGTVFKVNTDGTGFTNLHSFTPVDTTYNTNSDGANPQARLILVGNTLYGTAYYGGDNGNGTVFAVNTNGTGFTNLHSFTAVDATYNTNSDGANPQAALILSGNTLYGTASSGGSAGNGTVFALSTNGTGFAILYGFTGHSDGAIPQAELLLSGNMLFGTASYGGTNGNGTVFAVNTNGTGFTNLHSFAVSSTNSSRVYTNSDGAYPQAGLLLSGNTLYGTAASGGSAGEGTVFALNTNGTGFIILHSFAVSSTNSSRVYTNSDGAYPQAGLLLSGNTLYGTASTGGSAGNGTVFALNSNGTGFAVLHSFTAVDPTYYTNSDGANPQAALVLSGNTLYGTAFDGGSGLLGNGTVFALNTNGMGFTALHSFTTGVDIFDTNSDGADPYAGLILSGNTLYGTAWYGGSAGYGTVFALNTNGTGFTILHSFTGSPAGSPVHTNSDGANPPAGLILSGSTLYGTAYNGGGAGNGTVFKANTDGTGFTNLHSFTATDDYGYNSDGANPQARLILSGNTLYGTAYNGGSAGNGTVFAVHTDGTGFTNLHNFTSAGANPQAGLILSGNTLYGTAYDGGSTGNGTVFAVNTDGTGFTNLHRFTVTDGNGNNSDGANPQAGLILSGSTLYGTASYGGSAGYGTVFAVNTNGTGFTTLHSFALSSTNSSGIYTNSDGANPAAELVLSGNTLYGTAYDGGGTGNGTVFAVNTDGTGFTNLHRFTSTDGNGNNSDGANPQAGLILSGSTLYGTASYGGSAGYGTVFSLSLPLVVTTASLPSGANGVAYNQTVVAAYGQKPYGWTNSSGVLPPGLTLAASGVISGTPTVNGTFNFTVKVTDALSASATQALTLTVGSPPSVTTQPTNSWISVSVGSNVTFSVSVAGTGPFNYQWQLNGTNLPNGIITTVAGNGTNGYSGDGGAATNAKLSYPASVAVDTKGNLFIADEFNNRIRKVGTNGIIATVAGNGGQGYIGDGYPATYAELYYPVGVSVDGPGNLFIADMDNLVIRKVGTNAFITTAAGNGFQGYSGDGGRATYAELSYPNGVAVDTNGNLFIADSGNDCIRKVGTNGIITTVAGNGIGGYSGDGGAATNAELSSSGVAVDSDGNLFIADFGNNRIRKVGTNGIITTVVGNGIRGYSGDEGAGTYAELSGPAGVAVDTNGNLFIADYYNNRIRKVGTDGFITTVAGGGGDDPGDGGAATNAALGGPDGGPWGVAVDVTGNLFIADNAKKRIRKVVFAGPTLVLNDMGFGSAGTYDVVVSSPYGSVAATWYLTAGIILSAPQVTVGNTDFTFLLSGPAGSNYVLQVSTNLLNWSSVSTSAIPAGGSVTLSNAISGYNRRFYRAYLQ